MMWNWNGLVRWLIPLNGRLLKMENLLQFFSFVWLSSFTTSCVVFCQFLDSWRFVRPPDKMSEVLCGCWFSCFARQCFFIEMTCGISFIAQTVSLRLVSIELVRRTMVECLLGLLVRFFMISGNQMVCRWWMRLNVWKWIFRATNWCFTTSRCCLPFFSTFAC